jgi:hypothetical protein
MRSVAVPECFRTAQNAITEGEEMAGYGQLAMARNGQILLSANRNLKMRDLRCLKHPEPLSKSATVGLRCGRATSG